MTAKVGDRWWTEIPNGRTFNYVEAIPEGKDGKKLDLVHEIALYEATSKAQLVKKKTGQWEGEEGKKGKTRSV